MDLRSGRSDKAIMVLTSGLFRRGTRLVETELCKLVHEKLMRVFHSKMFRACPRFLVMCLFIQLLVGFRMECFHETDPSEYVFAISLELGAPSAITLGFVPRLQLAPVAVTAAATAPRRRLLVSLFFSAKSPLHWASRQNFNLRVVLCCFDFFVFVYP